LFFIQLHVFAVLRLPEPYTDTEDNTVKAGVYLIRNLWNGKIYIGSSQDVEERWKQHTSKLNRGTHPSRKLLNAWRKYGPSGFEFRIIELCNESQLLEREQYWIDTTLAFPLGYNSRPKAESCLGYKRGSPTAEHRRKNAEAHTGSNNPNWNKPRSEETKHRIAKAQKGRPRKSHSEKTRNQMSESQRARYKNGITDEHRLQLAAAQKRRVYRPHSEETKRKMREAHAKRFLFSV
jgi:group I intron endonuclease